MHEDKTARGMAFKVQLDPRINQMDNCITMLKIPYKVVILSSVAGKFEDTNRSRGADKMA
jgi:hypothetical protein